MQVLNANAGLVTSSRQCDVDRLLRAPHRTRLGSAVCVPETIVAHPKVGGVDSWQVPVVAKNLDVIAAPGSAQSKGIVLAVSVLRQLAVDDDVIKLVGVGSVYDE